MSDKTKRDLKATKNALLNAAAKLMTNCIDPSEVTSRAIAKESGVNLAMINYCFGSRESLLYEVFRKLLSDVQKRDTEFIKVMSSEMLPKQKLMELHFKMIKLMIANYSYSQAVTKYILFNRNDDIGMETISLLLTDFSELLTFIHKNSRLL